MKSTSSYHRRGCLTTLVYFDPEQKGRLTRGCRAQHADRRQSTCAKARIWC